MHVHAWLIRTSHENLLRGAGRTRPGSARQPRATAPPRDARADRGLGWPARMLWLWARRPGASGAPPDGAVVLLIPRRDAARRLITGLAWPGRRAAPAVAARPVPGDCPADLVVMREQERRRLRRELHDGLGPTLAALTLGLDTARVLSAGQPDLCQLLGRLTAETQRAITDLRRLVYGLRPPALDELGLAGSLREHIGLLQCAAPALAVSLDTPAGGLAGLPPAVELACYRIVTEALTNIARHAHATQCSVRLHIDHHVCVEVRDDGVGLPAGLYTGAGIASMRERAAELGGELVMEPCVPHGTAVTARLPVGEPR